MVHCVECVGNETFSIVVLHKTTVSKNISNAQVISSHNASYGTLTKHCVPAFVGYCLIYLRTD